MENQQNQNQPPGHIQNFPEINVPQNKPNYLKTIIFSVLVITSLSLITYLSFQNQKLQKLILNPLIFPTIQTQSPTPKTVSSISIPPDETSDWKIYTDQENGFSFKYPSNYLFGNYAPNDPSSPVLLNNRIDLNTSQYSAKECRGDCPIITHSESIFISTVQSVRMEGWVGSIGGEIPQSYVRYEVKLPSGKYFYITLWELLRGKSAMAENYFPDRKPESINRNDVMIFDQVLSTFKFLSTNELLKLSEEILIKGWYWGSFEQKLTGTPKDWVYKDAGRSSCWHKSGIECL